MSQRVARIIFYALITITLFSLWAGFALLVVNKMFYEDLPGYQIGRLCIWEFIALTAAALIAQLLIKNWGNIEVREIGNENHLLMNPKFGVYFSVYFLIAIIVGIWQFWIFSQNF